MKPDLVDPVAERLLRDLGARLRERRIGLGISAVSAAQAAGVSRVTWHRMESGSPQVSAGAYAQALAALGLAEGDVETSRARRQPGSIPTRIRVGDWPELRALAWSLRPETMLSPHEALAMYERSARHLDHDRLSEAERSLIDDLREGLADGVHP